MVTEHSRRAAAQSWDSYKRHEQTLVNAQEVPPRDQQRDLRPPVAVTVRLEWKRDGGEHLDTVARAWHGQTVLVDITDRRYRFKGVWLPAPDVERR